MKGDGGNGIATLVATATAEEVLQGMNQTLTTTDEEKGTKDSNLAVSSKVVVSSVFNYVQLGMAAAGQAWFLIGTGKDNLEYTIATGPTRNIPRTNAFPLGMAYKQCFMVPKSSENVTFAVESVPFFLVNGVILVLKETSLDFCSAIFPKEFINELKQQLSIACNGLKIDMNLKEGADNAVNAGYAKDQKVFSLDGTKKTQAVPFVRHLTREMDGSYYLDMEDERNAPKRLPDFAEMYPGTYKCKIQLYVGLSSTSKRGPFKVSYKIQNAVIYESCETSDLELDDTIDDIFG